MASGLVVVKALYARVIKAIDVGVVCRLACFQRIPSRAVGRMRYIVTGGQVKQVKQVSKCCWLLHVIRHCSRTVIGELYSVGNPQQPEQNST